MSVQAAARPVRPPPWRDVRVLRVLFQIAVVAVVAGVLLVLFDNLGTNLRRKNLETGFGYLDQPAGFAIADARFRSSQPVWRALVVGIRNTALVSFLGIGLATVIGLIVGVARLSRNWLVARSASLYVEALRNVPVLVIIIFIYTAVVLKLPPIERGNEWAGLVVLSNSGLVVPSLTRTGDAASLFAAACAVALAVAIGVAVWRTRRHDRTGQPHHRVLWAAGIFAGVVAVAFVGAGTPLGVSLPERGELRVTGGIRLGAEFAALLAGLVLYTASHIAEIVRGSILAVPKGQSEAATALGLREFGRYRFVVLPQALRMAVPPLANQFLNLTKNSSLAAFIAFPEVTRITQIIISQRSPAPQSIAILMGIYLVFSLTISGVMNLLNRRLQYRTR